MRLLVTGGGTGGHVYPALSVLEALWAEDGWATGRADVTWVGRSDSLEERIVGRAGLGFRAVDAGPLRGARPLEALASVQRIFRGYRQSRALIRELRPDVVMATGGYVSVPLVLAARSLGCPSLIYLPDMEPGLAARLLSVVADRMAVSFDSVARHLRGARVVVTGYPVRRALLEGDRGAARRLLGLSEAQPVLLVMGGSRGAQAMNRAVAAGLEEMLELAQVVHVSGTGDYEEAQRRAEGLPEPLRSRYHLYAYLDDEMPAALRAANLVVARAGAATLGEFPAVGLPAVLVPYPYAGRHQQVNADYLASRGAAVCLEDATLEDTLLPTVRALFGDADRLQRMAAAARTLAVPGAAWAIAQTLADLAAER